MAKQKETEEQKRAKNLKKARRAIYLWPVMFLLCIGCLCLFILDRQKSPHPCDIFDAMLFCGGLLYAAYGYSDAKYTIRTNGKERRSPGMAFALFLYMGSQLGRGISKHGFPPGLLLSLGASTLMILVCLLVLLYLRKARGQQEKQLNALKEADD